MNKTHLYSSILLISLTACSGEAPQNAATDAAPAATLSALDAAIAAMGVDDLQTLTYNGEAWRVRNSFRQTRAASPPWPERDTITTYQRTLDFSDPQRPSSRATGETFASNLFLEPPVPGTYEQNIPASQQNWGQQLEIWLTPWGFLKGAEFYGATESTQQLDGRDVTAISWQSPESQLSPGGLRYTVTGYLDGDNRIQRVETRVEDAFMGDMLVAALYSGYRDFDGVQVPTTMEQQRGSGGVFGVEVSDASPNPADAATLLSFPAAPAGGGGQGGPGGAPTAALTQIGEGLWSVNGGYTALVIEFSDHIVVFEAGQSEAWGEQVLAAAQAQFPDKPIRYLVNSHPHSDHTAGMVPFVRAGVTVVTHELNVPFLNMALSTPRTLLGEATLDPQFMSEVGALTVLEDDTNRLELHHVPTLHSEGMLVGLLPKQRVLFQADFTLPQPGAEPNPFVVDLANYVDSNALDFDAYLAVHAAQNPQTRADLMATIGK